VTGSSNAMDPFPCARRLSGQIASRHRANEPANGSRAKPARRAERGAHEEACAQAGARAALRQVLDNRAVIDPAVQHHVVDAIATRSPAQDRRPLSPLPAGLTPREAEVLTLIATGMSNSEIAEHLAVSEGTVKSHINHLLAKIDARDRAQAVTYAYQHGLTPPREQPG
jgi:DNA-binding NarL/FixJ family response regulator